MGDIIGWKMGLTVPAVQEHLGLEGPILGHLPRSAVDTTGEHSLAGGTAVAVEPELALEIGEDGGVAAMAVALEVVDLNRSLDELEEVIAENIFQRAVVFGPPAEPVTDPEVFVTINGEEQPAVRSLEPPADTLRFVHEFLGRFDVKPEPGHVVIAGSLTPAIPAKPGDVIEIRADHLGSAKLKLTA
jgi:2-keto-4-pentenoate hydratase